MRSRAGSIDCYCQTANSAQLYEMVVSTKDIPPLETVTSADAVCAGLMVSYTSASASGSLLFKDRSWHTACPQCPLCPGHTDTGLLLFGHCPWHGSQRATTMQPEHVACCGACVCTHGSEHFLQRGKSGSNPRQNNHMRRSKWWASPAQYVNSIIAFGRRIVGSRPRSG